MKDNKAIDKLIAAEQAKLEKLEEKYAEIGKKIKASKSAIAKYTMMKNNEKFNTLANALSDKGVSFEDVLSALLEGDVISLQEKIEQGNEAGEA